jgi:rubrerythrin
MTLLKKGTCSSPVVVSSSVYACSSCGHTEIVKGDAVESKKCPKCDAEMKLISAQAGTAESD